MKIGMQNCQQTWIIQPGAYLGGEVTPYPPPRIQNSFLNEFREISQQKHGTVTRSNFKENNMYKLKFSSFLADPLGLNPGFAPCFEQNT